MSEILNYLQPRQKEMVDFLRVLVEHESPTDNKKAVNKLGKLLEKELLEIGAKVDVVRQKSAGDHIRAEFDLREDKTAGREDGQVLVLCHLDTVWPVGEYARRPFRVEKGRAYGPGAYDMKAGIVMGIYAMKALKELSLTTNLRTVFILNSDEETQSHTSRELIEAECKKSKHVLGLEPKFPSGTVVTSRKTVATMTLEVTGKAAHAGAAPEKGVSAIREMVLQVIRLHRLSDPRKGTTVTVGIITGGSRPNIIPASAKAVIDVRVSSPEEDIRIKKALRNIEPITPGTSVKISGSEERPLWVRTSQSAALFERTKTIAAGLGLKLVEAGSGGVSDANFAGALGVPTLDGLGADGDGAHAENEHVDLSTLVPGTALIAELLRVLD